MCFICIINYNFVCVERNEFLGENAGRIHLFWLYVRLVIIEFILCEVWGKVRSSQFYHDNFIMQIYNHKFIITILSLQFYHHNFIIAIVSLHFYHHNFIITILSSQFCNCNFMLIIV